MSSHSTTSDSTISSNSVMSVNSIRPIYKLVELDLKEYKENELEFFIKSQLLSFEITNEKNNNPQRYYYKYNFNTSLPLCKSAYVILCEISDYKLLALQTHLQENGLIERIHGNAGHAKRRNSKVFLNLELTFEVKHYLINMKILMIYHHL